MGKQILAAEVQLEGLPKEMRSLLFADFSQTKHFISKRHKLDEMFLLFSDNHFVVYGVGDSFDPLLNFFLQYPGLFKRVHFYKNSEASVNHIFALASGLSGRIKGEHTILTDIQFSYTLAIQACTVGLVLDNLVKQALRVGKNVRRSTAIDQFGASVIEAMIEVLYQEFENLPKRKILIIGGGELAMLLTDYLKNEGIQNIIIATDNIVQGRKFLLKHKVGVVSMPEAEAVVGDVDIIAGTVPMEIAEGLTYVRPSKRKLFLDFGVDLKTMEFVRGLGETKIVTIDDLKRMQCSPLDMCGGVEEAWKIVQRESSKFVDVVEELNAVPVLQKCWPRITRLMQGKMNLLNSGLVLNQRYHEIVRSYSQMLMKKDSQENRYGFEFDRLIQDLSNYLPIDYQQRGNKMLLKKNYN